MMKLDFKLFVEGTLSEKQINVAIVDTENGDVLETASGVLQLDGSLEVDVQHDSQDFFIYLQGEEGALMTSTSEPFTVAPTITYDFTDGAYKAHGSNQKEIANGVFALFNGDFNKDGVIDNSDATLLDRQMSLADFNDNVTNSITKDVPFEIGAIIPPH